MKKAASRLIAIIACAAICGCMDKVRSGGESVAGAIGKSASNLSSTLEEAGKKLAKQPDQSTRISTRPSKIYIELNGEYIGRSPCVVKWKELIARKPELAKAETIVIKAYPLSPGLYTQVRVFNLTNDEERAQFPPFTIHFDMGMNPIGKTEEE